MNIKRPPRKDHGVHERPLIGRSRELRELYSTLDQARSGRGGTVIISGEAGIGKTRLAYEVADAALDSGFRVFWGRTWEHGGTPPLWPWLQIVRALLKCTDSETYAASSRDSAKMLLRFAEGDDLSRDLDAASRFLMFDGVNALLEAAQQQQEVLLVLDDLHNADSATLQLTVFVARNLAMMKVALLVLYRASGSALVEPTVSLLADVAREGTRLPLPGLDFEETRSLVSRMMDLRDVTVPLDRLHAATGGNPLLTQELVRSLPEWAGAPELGDPSDAGPTQMIERRLIGLDVKTRELLMMASVLGRDVDPSLLADLVGDEERLRVGVAVATAEGLLRADRDIPGWLQFSHDLIRQVLYDSIDPTRRKKLHLAVASALRDRETQHEENISARAHHLISADDVAPSEELIEACAQAAELALRRVTYEEAERFYEAAVQRAEPGSGRWVELSIGASEAQMKSGRRSAAIETALSAASAARALKDPISAALALSRVCASGRFASGLPDPRMTQALEEALKALPEEEKGLRASLIAALAIERTNEGGNLASAREAMRMARSSSDLIALLISLRALAGAAGPDETDEAMGATDELLKLSIRHRLLEEELRARARRCSYLIERGDLVRLDEELYHLAHTAEHVGHPLHLWIARTSQATRAMISADVTAVDRAVDEAFEQAQRAEHPYALAVYFLGKFYVAFQRGEIEPMEPALATVLQQQPTLLSPRACYALIAAESGRMDEARARLAPVMKIAGTLPKGATWMPTMFWTAWACARIGDRGWCETIYDLLAPYGDRHAVVSTGPPAGYFGSISEYLGMLAAICRSPESMVAHYEQAFRMYEAIGAVGQEAWARYNFARSLIACGERDHPRIQPLLDAAEKTAKGLGLTRLERAIRDLERSPSSSDATPTTHLSVLRRPDGWVLEYGDSQLRLPHMKGLDYLARVMARPGEELHVLDMVGTPLEVTAADSDLGPLLDEQAKAHYKKRLVELQQDLDEAQADGDLGRKERAQEEIDSLTQQLSGAFGLSGRDRKTGSAGEKARVAVQKAIRRVIERVAASDPELARALDSAVETGLYCSFRPPIGISTVQVRS